MMKKKRTATSVYLEDTDREAIAAIREHYGVASANDAIRIGLRELLRAIKKKKSGNCRPLKNYADCWGFSLL